MNIHYDYLPTASPTWNPTGYPDVNYTDADLLPINISFGDMVPIWVRDPPLEITWKATLVALILLVGLLGNFIVIFLVLRQPKIRQQAVNIYIVNLAIADFLTILFIPITALIANIYQNYELGPVMCKLEILIKMMCILASIFSVIAIATQRYLNISSSTSARNVQSSGPRTLLVIIVIWIVSILIALPLAIWRTYQERQWKDYLEKWCSDYPAEYSIRYWILLISPLIYIPLIVMVIIYWLMILKINRFIGKLQTNTGLTAKDASSSYDASTTSSPDLGALRESARIRAIQRRKGGQFRSQTEPSDVSLSHSYNVSMSYFVDEGCVRHNNSRRSSISSTYTPASDSVFPHLSNSTPTISSSSSNLPLPLAITFPPLQGTCSQMHSRQSSIHKLATVTDDGSSGRGKVGTGETESSSMSSPLRTINKYLTKVVRGTEKDTSVPKDPSVSQLASQLQSHRQAMSATVHKRSIMWTIILFSLLTFALWAPLQILVYYRALKPKQAAMACWYERMKFIAQMLCSINSAINPFITFRRTFYQMYVSFRNRQKQKQLRARLLKNARKLEPARPAIVHHRKAKPSMEESFNMTPIGHLFVDIQINGRIEIHQKNGSVPNGTALNGSLTPIPSPRRRSKERSRSVNDCTENGAVPSVSLEGTSPQVSFDPVAAYLAEQTSGQETPSPDVPSMAVPIFPPQRETIQPFDTQSEKGHVENERENDEQHFQKRRTTSLYTHNLTKQMLMKYTPERFTDD